MVTVAVGEVAVAIAPRTAAVCRGRCPVTARAAEVRKKVTVSWDAVMEAIALRIFLIRARRNSLPITTAITATAIWVMGCILA